MKTTERFSLKADDYERYRPHYPLSIIQYLKDKINLNSDWVIADIGSGTGISTKLFIENNNTVYAIEPNEAMRQKAEQLFEGNHKFISINATAESTSLKNNSIDMIIAGQAFHWFDRDKTKKEFERIAKRNAWLMLFWNVRDMNEGFAADYEMLLLAYGKDYKEVKRSNVMKKEIMDDFFHPCNYETVEFENNQLMDYQLVEGRLLSASYIPSKQEANYNLMLEDLRSLFNKHANNGKLLLKNTTQIYLGKINCS